MVDQLPNLGREIEMLSEMGLTDIEDLFSDIPADVRFSGALPLPPPQSEEEIIRDARRLLGANVDMGSRVSFLGGGLYRNYVPASVFQLVTRGEFLTAYTPYQPEVSQGMLQAMWEFQTLISELVGLPIANLSLYDGSTAAAEALTCAVRVHTRKASQPNIVYVSCLTPPDKLSVMENYCQGAEIEIKFLSHHDDGTLDMEGLKEATGSCGVYLEQPNPLGVLDEGLTKVKEIIGQNTALIVGVQPISLGMVEAPGHYGADIVVGEGQPLGSPVTAGGPIYGIFACTKPYLRLMPGRIVGRSIDVDGKEAYCLTLSTREQHIRRHRATSNICTNETLIALMGAMHMALLGPDGLHDLAYRNAAACQKAKEILGATQGVSLVHDTSHFNEFAIRVPGTAASCLEYLDQSGIIGGFDLNRWYSDATNQILVTTTDQTSLQDIQTLSAHLTLWANHQEVEA
ncbi:MAG: aminomethyl-transferring glycine dehydrogenase subunit GcvPA [Candidatus Poseidonia sp.]|nr:aminomethyl-transferring glycine dehydrogenase subunit GcvPA [Poseidonia sp.]